MDKAWAVRAGLGWMGKHTNLITKEYGSWVFIGEIIVNLELDYAPEIVPDHCGSCTACLDACPTAAIVAPFLVDSKACLSYATIELRASEFSPEISENLEGWLYGCDICQDVCPWNRFQKPAGEPGFEPREDGDFYRFGRGFVAFPGKICRKVSPHGDQAGQTRRAAAKRPGPEEKTVNISFKLPSALADGYANKKLFGFSRMGFGPNTMGDILKTNS